MALYLDYNASSPIHAEVLNVMMDVYKNIPGNPDSRTHTYGANAQKKVQSSRSIIANILNVDPTEVIFTSGSTESNNTAILGILEYARKANKKHIITSAIEHKSVIEPLHLLERQGFKVDFITPDTSGRINSDLVISHLTPETCLVSLMHVNSETGIIQPVEEIGKHLKNTDIYFHVDATQSLGKLNDTLRTLSYDMLSISSHKIGGPQGIGALILKRGTNYKRPPITPLLYGGNQERGFRAGTVPVALVAGFAKAMEISDSNQHDLYQKCKDIKSKFLKSIEGMNYTINGDPLHCIPSTINISFDGIDAEAAFLCLGNEYAISNGSACNSSTHALSYVLTAMKLSEKIKSEAIRLSWDGSIDIDFEPFVSIIKSMLL